MTARHAGDDRPHAAPDDAGAIDHAARRVATARRALVGAADDADAVDVAWAAGWEDEDGWALALDALRFLTALVRRLQPAHVLELGSGLSTLALARERQLGGGRSSLTVLEHDPAFAEQSARKLQEDGVADGVELRLTHLVSRRYRGSFLPVYWEVGARLEHDPRADLVLADGPPGPLGGREGAIYQALERSRPGTLILLDDADRAQESAILDTLGTAWGPAVEVHRLPGFTKGLGCVLVVDPAPLRSLRGAATPRKRDRERPHPPGPTPAARPTPVRPQETST